MSASPKLTITPVVLSANNDIRVTVSGSFNIEFDARQACESVMDRFRTEQLARARQDAFAYHKNPQNLESPWCQVYRIILDSVIGLNSAMGIEMRNPSPVWNDPADAPPVNLSRTIRGSGRSVIPDLDVVM
ncbi:hypothetical protein GYMLUDRAFT_71226 [Collybiopsis luxurians FD-317 M1]|nr:hypothetical protein GYMLUDRAFT_71226 [Collybiopsis luxurians FD-317 M1]